MKKIFFFSYHNLVYYVVQLLILIKTILQIL